MNKFFKWLEEKFVPIIAKFGNQRHVLAIRDGFISAMPLMIVGSFLLILAFPPFQEGTEFFLAKAWINFANKYFDNLMMPFNMTMGIMTIFISIAIGYSLAKSYGLDALSGGMLSLMSFLLVAAQMKDGGLPTAFLGGTGIFTAILTSVFSIEILRFLKKKNWTIKLPEGVPPRIAVSFETLIPVFICVIIFYPLSILVKTTTGMSIPAAIMKLFEPLLVASDSLGAVIIAALICHLLWFAGIHGASIVSGIMQTFWMTNLAANQAALKMGEALPKIFMEPFWAFYIVIGGSGATLALTILYLKSKSSHLKSIGKVAILPALFNINEPVIFGTPIVMNPIFFIPFILAPIVNGTIAYIVLKLGLVSKIVSLPPWTTPAPIGAMWAAGWDIRAAILVLVLAVVSGIIYYPFVKIHENRTKKDQEDKVAA